MPFRILGEPWKTLGGSFGGILGSGPRGQLGVDFLFRDDFITAEAAPLTSPRTAEPGPGILTITDTGNNAQIDSSDLFINNTVSGNDPRLYDISRTRAAGLAAYFLYKKVANNNTTRTGWSNNNALRPLTSAIQDATNVFSALVSATIISTGITSVINTDYPIFVVLRDAGMFVLIEVGGQWLLAWVDDSENTAALFAGLAHATTVDSRFGTMRVSQLPSPWDTDYGIATDRLAGARIVGDTFVHEADCLIEFEQTTLPGALTTRLHFRIQDALNYWRIHVGIGGGLQLTEVVAGVTTVRINAGGVINGSRIVAIADDETISLYNNNVLAGTYALAANFKTETSGELARIGAGGVVSDIVTWPRIISSTARRALDRVANA